MLHVKTREGKIKKVIVVLLSVLVLSACGTQPPIEYDPAQDDKNYKACMDKGGSFSKTRDGFSCSLDNL